LILPLQAPERAVSDPPSLARISLCPPKSGTGLETRASEGGRSVPCYGGQGWVLGARLHYSINPLLQ